MAHAKKYETTGLKEAAKAFSTKMRDYEPMLNNDTALLATILDPTYKLTALPDNQKDRIIDILR